MFVEIKALLGELLGLCYRILDQTNKVSMSMSLSRYVFFKDTTCFRYPLSRNASNRLCVNKCTAQYDVRSPHTTRLPRYARLLFGPTFILSHFTRNAASRVQCLRIIKIYKVLIFPFIALTHRVIARRLCERTFNYDYIRVLARAPRSKLVQSAH